MLPLILVDPIIRAEFIDLVVTMVCHFVKNLARCS